MCNSIDTRVLTIYLIFCAACPLSLLAPRVALPRNNTHQQKCIYPHSTAEMHVMQASVSLIWPAPHSHLRAAEIHRSSEGRDGEGRRSVLAPSSFVPFHYILHSVGGRGDTCGAPPQKTPRLFRSRFCVIVLSQQNPGNASPLFPIVQVIFRRPASSRTHSVLYQVSAGESQRRFPFPTTRLKRIGRDGLKPPLRWSLVSVRAGRGENEVAGRAMGKGARQRHRAFLRGWGNLYTGALTGSLYELTS